MDKLLKAKKWLTLEDAARRLSISFDEKITESDIVQLCAEKRLSISVCLTFSFAYSSGRRFCPVAVDEFILNCIASDYIRKAYPEQHDGLTHDDYYESLSDDDKQAVWLYAADTVYQWFDPEIIEATFRDEHRLKGVYEISSKSNPRFYNWIMEVSLKHESPIHGKECHTRLLNLVLHDESTEVELVFVDNNETRFNKIREMSGFEYDYKEYQNPVINELYDLLVIQTHHLLELEDYLLGESQHDYKPPLPIQKQREQVLADLLNEFGDKSLSSLRRIEVWRLLNGRDSELFPPRDNSEDSMLKGFYRNQKLIGFKRGRKG